MFKHILIATDGSDLSDRALTQGLELGRALNAPVVVLTVVAPFPMPAYGNLPTEQLIAAYDKATTETTARIVTNAKRTADAMNVRCETLHVTGEPADCILDTAKSKNCDLIVMASHGYKGLKRLLLGSVATKVIMLSDRPVLVCR
jgi:nucleotide-binding universal stress UspA family protein